MADLTLRNVKGSPLTNQEVDDNFSNLNTDKWSQDNTKISNWDTAYSWGDHAAVGYLTTLDGDGSDLLNVRAETVEVVLKNVSGSTIPKGTPVHQTGTAGAATFEVVPADASSASVMPAHFIAGEELANEAEGRGILVGRISGVDTSAFAEGDTIYVAPGGGYTNTAPTGEGNLIQNLGTVTRSDATNGGGEVYGAGRTAATPNLNQGNIFIGDATNRAVTAALSTSVEALASYNNANWDTAYSWGNHASVGYLTSIPSEYLTETEGDARYLSINATTLPDQTGHAGQFLTTNGTTADWATVDTSLGDTAYGWGDHASVGYLTSASLTGYATQTYVNTAVSNLVDSAPATLDTLNELAAALGDDPNFATTVTNSIATKLPLAGGTLSGNLIFGDNDKAIFGAGSDLQIYHDGSNSRIQEAGTGNLIIRADDFRLQSVAGESYIEADANGAVALRYDNALKLATTATGIDVTGEVTADSAVVVVSDTVANNSVTGVFIDHNASGADTLTADRSHIAFQIDMDSSATGGDTANEHRVYGSHINVRATGDSDVIYGSFVLAEAQHADGTISALYGDFNQALVDHDGGHIANAFATYSYTYMSSGGGTIGNAYGNFSKVLVSGAHNIDTPKVTAVYGEIEADANTSTPTTITNAYCFEAQFDNDTGSNVTINNGYLFYGNYAGGLPTNAWGVYIIDDVENYFAGPIRANSYKVGSTTVIDSSRNLANIGTLNGGTPWHSGNDGSGSGLDADLLDGQQGSYYATAASVSAIAALDPVITLTGAVTGSGTMTNLGSVSIATTATADPTLTLTGDVTGSATFTNLGNATLTAVVADDSHNHIISNVDGLQTALDGKLPLNGGTLTGDLKINKSNAAIYLNDSGGSPTNQGMRIRAESIDSALPGSEGIGIIFEQDPTNGSPDTTPAVITTGEFYAQSSQKVFHDAYHPNADTLTTARTITLGGDLSGSASFNGSSNITITATVADDSHNHIISNVDGLQTALDAKLASSSYTASDVLTKIKTVDGSGSGLDADLLDGVQGSSFLRSDVADTSTGLIEFQSGIGVHRQDGVYVTPISKPKSVYWKFTEAAQLNSPPGSGSWRHVATIQGWTTHSSSYPSWQMSFGNGAFGVRQSTSTSAWAGWQTVWTSGNDGSGSGLDADLLDGVDSSSFLRSDANDTATGVITFQNSSDAQISLNGNGTSWAGMTFTDSGGTDNLWFNGANRTFTIGGGGSNVAGKKLHVDGGLSVGSSSDSTATPSEGIYSQGQISVAGSTVWHAGNDGSGSGLDADLLDGIQAASFLRSDTTATMSGRLEMAAVLDMNNQDIYGVDQIFHQGDTNTYMQFHAADQWRVVTGGSERLEVNNTNTTVQNNLIVNGDFTVNGIAGGSISTATNSGAVNYVYASTGGTPTRGSCPIHVYHQWSANLNLTLTNSSWVRGDMVVIKNTQGTNITVTATRIYLPNGSYDTSVTFNGTVGSFTLIRYTTTAGYWMVGP